MNQPNMINAFVKLAFLLCFLIFCSCNSSKKWTRSMEPDLYQHWIHVFEEDNPSAKMYRPFGYSVNPARGRESFEIQKDGVLIYRGFGPNDAPTNVRGQWKMLGKNQISFLFDSNPELNRSMDIIALTETYFVVKP